MFRLLLALFFLAFSAQAFAAAGEWKGDDVASARLVSGVTAVGSGGSVPLGIEIKLARGWHTYWRAPGSAGLPPQLDWSRSQTDDGNLDSAALLYPAPRRYVFYGLEAVGYNERVLFPIDATLRHAGKPLVLDVSADILVCQSICAPKHFDLSLAVPEGESLPSAEAADLHRAREKLPASPEEAGILLKGVVSDGESLTFSVSTREAMVQPDIFVESEKNIGFGAPEVTADPSGHAATLKVRPVDTMPEGVRLAGLPLTLTIVNGAAATEIRAIAPEASTSPVAFDPPKVAFGLAVLFAFLGGFILNLMPCVLPVLSLKIVSVVSHGGGDKTLVRQSFLVTAAGIIFSFLVLGGVMAALRGLEMTFGWGVQFQQPGFLMFLVILLTFFASNLWGLFDVSLPRFLADKIDSPYHPKLAGDFATGAFATLLATPCSAPFLGTAVGFAMVSGVREIFAVFSALGAGMALPYLAVALFPCAATCLPKPGAWMIVLRRILGFALGFTALWLVWVMAAQITPRNAGFFALMMAAVTILLALKKYGSPKKLAAIGLVVVCAAAVAVGAFGKTRPYEASTDRQWIAYNEATLRADLAEGKTVFLDVTADWCLTCVANKKIALSDENVVRRLFYSDVIAMQANWTNPDPAISDLLHKYGRYGIPFNAVFGPGAPQGIVLPELLTPSAVLKALDDVQGNRN